MIMGVALANRGWGGRGRGWRGRNGAQAGMGGRGRGWRGRNGVATGSQRGRGAGAGAGTARETNDDGEARERERKRGGSEKAPRRTKAARSGPARGVARSSRRRGPRRAPCGRPAAPAAAAGAEDPGALRHPYVVGVNRRRRVAARAPLLAAGPQAGVHAVARLSLRVLRALAPILRRSEAPLALLLPDAVPRGREKTATTMGARARERRAGEARAVGAGAPPQVSLPILYFKSR